MAAAISNNPFALLSGGDSDEEGSTPKLAAIKSLKASQPVVPQPKKTIPGQQQVKRDRGDYPSRGAPRKVYGSQPSGPDEVIGSKPAGVTELGRDDRAERRGSGTRGGRGSRGRAVGRGRGGGRFDERPDRHSATGTHDTDRKVASGWGAEEGKQELQAETEGWGDAKADMAPAETDDAWGTNAAADVTAPVANGHTKTVEAEDSKEEEEEDKTKTLEEYLAEKANATNNLISLKKDIRKPNEGVDDSQWKNAVKLVKGEEEEEVFFQANKEKKVSQNNKKVKEKTYIEVEPVGYRPPRTGGERGARGRGRGRGDRDFPDRREFNDNRVSPRGGRGRGGPQAAFGRSTSELNTEDSNAFPSLS